MNCLFCNQKLVYNGISYRVDGEEWGCFDCVVSALRCHFSLKNRSKCYFHVKNGQVLFQDISIGLINLEHDLVKKITSIAEWKGKSLELVPIMEIPLNLDLNTYTLKALRDKINLYLSLS